MMARKFVKFTGEPGDARVSRPVRWGAVGKVLCQQHSNSLSAYPTASEYDPTAQIFFGYVIGLEDELGYFSLEELEEARGPLGLPIERDEHFKPASLKELQQHYRQNGYAK
jgi:hypothetical protein